MIRPPEGILLSEVQPGDVIDASMPIPDPERGNALTGVRLHHLRQAFNYRNLEAHCRLDFADSTPRRLTSRLNTIVRTLADMAKRDGMHVHVAVPPGGSYMRGQPAFTICVTLFAEPGKAWEPLRVTAFLRDGQIKAQWFNSVQVGAKVEPWSRADVTIRTIKKRKADEARAVATEAAEELAAETKLS